MFGRSKSSMRAVDYNPPPPKRWRYRCQSCGFVFTAARLHKPPSAPPCTQCDGPTVLIPRRRQGVTRT